MNLVRSLAFVILATLGGAMTRAEAGSVVAWGSNGHGQCMVPSVNADFVAVAAGQVHGLGLKSDGAIVTWGFNGYGQCDVPVPNAGFVAVAGGGQHSLGLKSDGTIVAWGSNDYGQCTVPAPNAGFVAISGGSGHSLGLRSDGTIAAWGLNHSGQCDIPAPNAGFVAVAAGAGHSLGLKSDGRIVAWGDSQWGGAIIVPSPNSNFVALSAGVYHSLGLKSDGTIVAWGSNSEGQCNVPAPNADFVAVAAGAGHSLGLKSDGTIVAWGSDGFGQCNIPSPNAGFLAVSAGDGFSLGLWAPPTGGGACCHDDGLCSYTIQEDCLTPSAWLGNGTICNPCPQPLGSCCLPTGVCSVTLQVGCFGIWTMFGVCTPSSCADAGPNGGGVLWVHDTGIVYSVDLSLPPVSAPPGDCASVDNQQEISDGSIHRIWKVYAAFPEGSHPRLKCVQWGTQFPEWDTSPASYVWVDGGGVPDEDGPGTDFFIGDLGFPTASGGTIGQSFPNARTSTVVALYFFYGFGYSAGSTFPAWSTAPHSVPEARCFQDDGNPPRLDPILGYGTLGFGDAGTTPCPSLDAVCCAPDGTCAITREADCPATSSWHRAWYSCAPNPCPLPTGACCFADRQCHVITLLECPHVGGVYQGDFTLCEPNPCPMAAACCMPNGVCLIRTEISCAAYNPPGIWHSDWTSCDPNLCPVLAGACCTPDGYCTVTFEAECTDPNLWQGQGISCTSGVCTPSAVDDGLLATTLRVRAAPTPFAGRTALVFAGPYGKEASLLIVDASGRRVRSAWQGVLNGRTITLQWDGRDDSGREAPSGVYLARLRSGEGATVARLVKAR